MKIIAIVLIVFLILIIGVTMYVYLKMGMFLPALLGFSNFPKTRESIFFESDGKYRIGTKDDKMSFFMQHPIFNGYNHMFFNVEDNVLKAIAPVKYEFFLKKQQRSDQLSSALDSFNYLIKSVEDGRAWLISDFYNDDVVKKNPYKSHLTGMFYKGEIGKPLAVVIPGGGFISNVTDCEGYPLGMKLHQRGYSVLVVSYPIGKQLGEIDPEKRGQQASNELVQVIKYLHDNSDKLEIDMEDYAIFGFSAGGLMTTSFAFSNYSNCCHSHDLYRPKVIFPLYGLDWNVKPLPQDRGLSVFSIVGRKDPFGFADIESKIPKLNEILGQDNVSIRIYDNLGHGFGLGVNTQVKNWEQEAVDFWERHR